MLWVVVLTREDRGKAGPCADGVAGGGRSDKSGKAAKEPAPSRCGLRRRRTGQQRVDGESSDHRDGVSSVRPDPGIALLCEQQRLGYLSVSGLYCTLVRAGP